MSFSERLEAVTSEAPHEVEVTLQEDSSVFSLEVDGPLGTKLLSAIRLNGFRVVYVDEGESLKFEVRLIDTE
jgi:hypothetical protein